VKTSNLTELLQVLCNFSVVMEIQELAIRRGRQPPVSFLQTVTPINIRTRFDGCTRFQVKSRMPQLNASYMGKPSFIFGNGSCLFVLRILVCTIKHSKKILKYLEIGHNRLHSHPFHFVVVLKSSYHLTLRT